jgi:hypothetical protein
LPRMSLSTHFSCVRFSSFPSLLQGLCLAILFQLSQHLILPKLLLILSNCSFLPMGLLYTQFSVLKNCSFLPMGLLYTQFSVLNTPSLSVCLTQKWALVLPELTLYLTLQAILWTWIKVCHVKAVYCTVVLKIYFLIIF